MGGVYIHIPFCASKCPYCDFYSYRAGSEQMKEYTQAVIDEINTLSRVSEYVESFKADTLYIGGGTPSVLGGDMLSDIVDASRGKFGLDGESEITVECNPSGNIEELIPYFRKAGVNRISLGMQSAVENERKALGRTSSKERIGKVIGELQNNGIDNVSLDIMLGIPFQTEKSLRETLDFAVSLGAKHLSAYILKIEENTFFYKNREKYDFPDDDAVCDLYEFACEYLKYSGFDHYEISNFALPGYESRHNNKYWRFDDYLGIGAAAHSYVDKKRFCFERDADAFIKGAKPVFDGYGGDETEYIMLSLRLKEGLSYDRLSALYGAEPIERIKKKVPFLEKQGLVKRTDDGIRLTVKGILISNSVINELTD